MRKEKPLEMFAESAGKGSPRKKARTAA